VTYSNTPALYVSNATHGTTTPHTTPQPTFVHPEWKPRCTRRSCLSTTSPGALDHSLEALQPNGLVSPSPTSPICPFFLVSTCVCVRVCACACKRARACACACACACVCVCICMWMCLRMCVRACVYIHIYICMYIYMYMYVCMYVCMYVYMYRYSVYQVICVCVYVTNEALPMNILSHVYRYKSFEYVCVCVKHIYTYVCMHPPKNGLIALQTPRTSRFPTF